MFDITVAIKPHDNSSDVLELHDVIAVYPAERITRAPSAKHLWIHVTNVPSNLTFTDARALLIAPHLGPDVIDPHGVSVPTTVQPRLHYVDIDALPPLKRTELLAGRETTVTWGQFKSACMRKTERHNFGFQRGAGRAVTDLDVSSRNVDAVLSGLGRARDA